MYSSHNYCSLFCNSRELFTKVHYFIHLNLSISLCLAYIAFVAGIEKAIAYEVGPSYNMLWCVDKIIVKLTLCCLPNICARVYSLMVTNVVHVV